MPAKASDDPNSPKGDIAPARAALRRFSTTTPSPKLMAYVDVALKAMARRFNRDLRIARDGASVAETKETLERLKVAADSYARALDRLDETALGVVLGDAMLRRALLLGAARGRRMRAAQDAPDAERDGDAIGVAWSPEIGPLPERRLPTPRDFVAPTVARAKAVARIAHQALLAIGDAIGSGEVDASAPFALAEPAKESLVDECFWLVVDCFGPEAAEKITTTPPRKDVKRPTPPPFHGLVSAVFAFAVGQDAAIPPANFERTIKAKIDSERAALKKWGEAVGRPFPLAEERSPQPSKPRGVR